MYKIYNEDLYIGQQSLNKMKPNPIKLIKSKR